MNLLREQTEMMGGKGGEKRKDREFWEKICSAYTCMNLPLLFLALFLKCARPRSNPRDCGLTTLSHVSGYFCLCFFLTAMHLFKFLKYFPILICKNNIGRWGDGSVGKACATKPHDVTLTPWIHSVKGQTQLTTTHVTLLFCDLIPSNW